MTQEQILNAPGKTKTWRIQQLLRLGLDRQEVARLVGTNYGFVHNVYARLFPERIRRRRTVSEVIEEAEYNLTNFFFNHTFGVEIEAFGISRQELETELNNAGIPTRFEGYTHATRDHWKIVTDSSIEGQQSFEIVSPKLKGEEGLRQLKTVTLILRGLEARVNRSCGLHIHFDASGFNAETWKNIFKNYAKIEHVIDNFMPNSRRGNSNTFCKSVRTRNYEQRIDSMRNLVDAENAINHIYNHITRGSRFYKVNPAAYFRHRSIEFRQHSGTVNFSKIKNWILFLARFIEFSKQANLTQENIESLRRFLPDEMINYFEARRRELAA